MSIQARIGVQKHRKFKLITAQISLRIASRYEVAVRYDYKVSHLYFRVL
jgi:hypothetical protein